MKKTVKKKSVRKEKIVTAEEFFGGQTEKDTTEQQKAQPTLAKILAAGVGPESKDIPLPPPGVSRVITRTVTRQYHPRPPKEISLDEFLAGKKQPQVSIQDIAEAAATVCGSEVRRVLGMVFSLLFPRSPGVPGVRHIDLDLKKMSETSGVPKITRI